MKGFLIENNVHSQRDIAMSSSQGKKGKGIEEPQEPLQNEGKERTLMRALEYLRRYIPHPYIVNQGLNRKTSRSQAGQGRT